MVSGVLEYPALFGTWSSLISQLCKVPEDLKYPALYGIWSSLITQLCKVPGDLKLYGTWSPRIPSSKWYLEFSYLFLVCNQKRDKSSQLVYPGGIRELCQGYSLKLSEIVNKCLKSKYFFLNQKFMLWEYFPPIPKKKLEKSELS